MFSKLVQPVTVIEQGGSNMKAMHINLHSIHPKCYARKELVYFKSYFMENSLPEYNTAVLLTAGYFNIRAAKIFLFMTSVPLAYLHDISHVKSKMLKYVSCKHK